MSRNRRFPGRGRALLEGEGVHRGSLRAVTGDVKVGGGGFWRLGLVLEYGNAFGVESGPWGGGRGYHPPPLFKRFPGQGAHGCATVNYGLEVRTDPGFRCLCSQSGCGEYWGVWNQRDASGNRPGHGVERHCMAQSLDGAPPTASKGFFSLRWKRGRMDM